MLRIVVLGAAAGGGVPQWNCGCPVCRTARREKQLHQHAGLDRVSRDGAHWYLVNASPDLRQQLIATPQLHPAKGQLRHSPIAGVILTNGEIDAIAGLLSMREGSPFALYAHPRVLAILGDNSIFNVLSEKNVRAPADRDGQAVRADPARRLAVGHRGDRRSRFPARARGISKARRIRPAATPPAIRWGFVLRTRRADNISTSSPPVPAPPTS